MDRILPKLSKEEQNQVITAISQFSKFLMTTQEFISCTLLGVKYAETLEHLCTAIPTETIRSLIEEVQSLLQKFQELQIMIKTKVKEESSLHSFRNMMLGRFFFLLGCPNVSICVSPNFSSVGLCALGAGILLIGTGVGAVFAVGAATLKVIATVGATAAIIGGAAAGYAHAAIQVSDFGQVMGSLQKIRDCLVVIAQEQSDLKGNREALNNLRGRSNEQETRIVNDMIKTFTDTLNKTQAEVTKGFNILKTF